MEQVSAPHTELELPWWGRPPWFYMVACTPLGSIATVNWFLGNRAWTLFDLAILATVLPALVLLRRAAALLHGSPSVAR